MTRSTWLFVFCCVLGAAGQTPRPRAIPPKLATSENSARPKFKAIWEPINYPEDLTFNDIFFANDQVGWIAGASGGKGGFILQTRDGGDHWTLRLGDPQSNDQPIHSFRFIDDTHGSVVQGGKLLRTSDGTNWEDAGTISPDSFRDYVFTSPTRGIVVSGYPLDRISTTKDGGKTWKQVFQCATKLEVNGLMQNTGCELEALHFPTASVGYAVGGSMDDSPGHAFFVVAKTEDGGESWKVVSTVGNIAHAGTVFFVDSNTGFTRNNDGKFYATADGGLTWRAMTGSGDNLGLNMAFVDSEVAWDLGTRSMAFSADGGKHWNSRDFHFPADVRAFSLPRRNRAYVVGDHGMIYRYRVVPVEYTSKGMVDAPMMPAAAGTNY